MSALSHLAALLQSAVGEEPHPIRLDVDIDLALKRRTAEKMDNLLNGGRDG
jgi:hypothetical protein